MTESNSGTGRQMARYLAGTLALVCLLALVAPFIVYGVPQLVGGDTSFVVVSGSMEPKINTGDVIIVTETRPEQISTGDVITFIRSQNSAPITHRVLDVTQREDGSRAFLTKGDANEDADGAAVPEANVVGRVTLTIPYIGHVVQFGKTSLGLVLLLVVPIVLLILNEAWTFVRGNWKPTSDDAEEASADSPEIVDRDQGSAFEFTQADLNLSLAVLAATAVFAGYMSYAVQTESAIMGFVAAVGGFVLVAAIRYASPPGEPVLAVTENGIALSLQNRIVEGIVPETVRSRPQVPLNSVSDLVAMARAVDGWIVADGESLFLATSDLVYTCEATVVSGETDASEADGESDDDWNEWERPGQSQDRSDRSDEQVAVNGGRSVAEDREDENAE